MKLGIVFLSIYALFLVGCAKANSPIAVAHKYCDHLLGTPEYGQCFGSMHNQVAGHYQYQQPMPQSAPSMGAVLGDAAQAYQHQQDLYNQRYNQPATQCMARNDGYGRTYVTCQ